MAQTAWKNPPVLMTVLALTVLVGTLALVIVRPRGLGIGWSALGGAVICLLTGLVSVSDLPEVVHVVGDATLAFVGIVLISMILDGAGVLRWAALHVARLGGGSPLRLFVLVVLLGAVCSALLSNDGAALILTPIVVGVVTELRMGARATLAYVIACGFIADTASAPLVISNLVNMVVARSSGIGFLRYAAVMVPVSVIAVLASLAMLLVCLHRSLPQRYELTELASPASAITDPVTARAAGPVMLLLLAGYALGDGAGVPLSVTAGVAALVLGIIALIGGRIDVPATVRAAPWQVIVFAGGMYVVVFALRNRGLTDVLGAGLAAISHHGMLAAVLGTGIVVALLAAIINNLPATLVAVLAIQSAGASGPLREALLLSTVIGADLGPKFTPIGSLATLLWLHLLAQRGITITWGQYLRTGLVLTTPVLLITLAALAGAVSLDL